MHCWSQHSPLHLPQACETGCTEDHGGHSTQAAFSLELKTGCRHGGWIFYQTSWMGSVVHEICNSRGQNVRVFSTPLCQPEVSSLSCPSCMLHPHSYPCSGFNLGLVTRNLLCSLSGPLWQSHTQEMSVHLCCKRRYSFSPMRFGSPSIDRVRETSDSRQTYQ